MPSLITVTEFTLHFNFHTQFANHWLFQIHFSVERSKNIIWKIGATKIKITKQSIIKKYLYYSVSLSGGDDLPDDLLSIGGKESFREVTSSLVLESLFLRLSSAELPFLRGLVFRTISLYQSLGYWAMLSMYCWFVRQSSSCQIIETNNFQVVSSHLWRNFRLFCVCFFERYTFHIIMAWCQLLLILVEPLVPVVRVASKKGAGKIKFKKLPKYVFSRGNCI